MTKPLFASKHMISEITQTELPEAEDQLLDVSGRRRRVGGIVEDDVIDFLAANGRRQEGDRVLFRDAERSRRAGCRN